MRISHRVRRIPPSLLFLIVAWLCANQPQGFVAEVVVWFKGAARFSHQQQLAQELRVALAPAAQPTTDVARMVAANDTTPAPAPAVPVPTMTLGKSPLALVGAFELLPPAAARFTRGDGQFFRVNRTRDVPVPVPRAPA